MVNKIDIQSIITSQEADQELQQLILNQDNTTNSFVLHQIKVPSEKSSIWCEVSTQVNRPYIPTNLREIIFQTIHGLSHPSVRATRKLICEKYFWPGINADINSFAKSCMECQRSKINRHTKSKFGSFDVPKGRFEHVHMDIVGPLPQSNGHTYLLTMIDRFTRWVEAVPLRNILAATVAEKFVEVWIARFCVPLRLTTDQGSQFESLLFCEMSRFLGTHRIHTTTYHPQSNGMIERFHRHLKSAFRAACRNNNWHQQLPWILLGIRTSVKEDIGYSSSQLLFGQSLRLPGEFIINETNITTPTSEIAQKIRNSILQTSPKNIRVRRQTDIFVTQDIQSCSHVFILDEKVKSKLQAPYLGPYKVVSRNDKVFEIEIDGNIKKISIDRLKPAYLLKEGSSINTRSFANKRVAFQL